MNIAKILGGFQVVYVGLYKDLRGFDPSLLQNSIPIKEGMKPAMKEQRPINFSSKETLQRELENFLRTGIIF
jgi:hypothetical protein